MIIFSLYQLIEDLKMAYKKEGERGSMSEAMKSTRGVCKDGMGKGEAGKTGYSMPEVRMPFGGNVSANCGKPLPKAEKGLS